VQLTPLVLPKGGSALSHYELQTPKLRESKSKLKIKNRKNMDDERQRLGAGHRRKNILEILMGDKVVEEAVRVTIN
jgi:hypothetical protein